MERIVYESYFVNIFYINAQNSTYRMFAPAVYTLRSWHEKHVLGALLIDPHYVVLMYELRSSDEPSVI